MLQRAGVDYLGVAYVDEGVNLRQWGIDTPIIVMNPEDSSITSLIKYRLEPEIYSMRVLRKFSDELEKYNFTQPYPVHIKMDTGMHRLGFSHAQLPELIDFLREHPHIKVGSTFSHLAAAEDPREDEFTRSQLARFEDMANTLIGGVGYHITRHILNTSGIIRYADKQYEMVRMGLGLYGYIPFYEIQRNLKCCATLRTVISQIRTLDAGETVSYNRRYRVQNTSRIATLPIGYADGISRLWGNGRGYVTINGQKATIVGSICMDMMMVDVTGIECNEGDTAVLIGRDPSADVIAEEIGTIPYEVLIRVSDRVKRIYTLRI
ncbi:MAG: alanine racemase, partial [Flavobacteriales bacterium]|nr:alanine racemase [Flavobacteriales bacterium]